MKTLQHLYKQHENKNVFTTVDVYTYIVSQMYLLTENLHLDFERYGSEISQKIHNITTDYLYTKAIDYLQQKDKIYQPQNAIIDTLKEVSQYTPDFYNHHMHDDEQYQSHLEIYAELAYYIVTDKKLSADNCCFLHTLKHENFHLTKQDLISHYNETIDVLEEDRGHYHNIQQVMEETSGANLRFLDDYLRIIN